VQCDRSQSDAFAALWKSLAAPVKKNVRLLEMKYSKFYAYSEQAAAH
jgi:hypothetical protein